jgi:putative endonuclease
MEKSYNVYILASGKNGTLYIGVTNELIRRVYQHKHKLFKGFSSAYGVTKLVYFESYKYISEAIAREKQLKKWNREWKMKLIEENNPMWRDLYYDFGGDEYERGLKFEMLKDSGLDSRLRGNDK